MGGRPQNPSKTHKKVYTALKTSVNSNHNAASPLKPQQNTREPRHGLVIAAWKTDLATTARTHARTNRNDFPVEHPPTSDLRHWPAHIVKTLAAHSFKSIGHPHIMEAGSHPLFQKFPCIFNCEKCNTACTHGAGTGVGTAM